MKPLLRKNTYHNNMSMTLIFKSFEVFLYEQGLDQKPKMHSPVYVNLQNALELMSLPKK